MFIPTKEIICEELEFSSVERKFYNDLQTKGVEMINKLAESKGGLSKNYMCLLTMLLRLRQGICRFQLRVDVATDHIDLLKDKVDIEVDVVEKSTVDDDDLVAMMGGLGIETKCTICFTMYLLQSCF